MEAPDKIYISPNIENRTWLIGKADTVNIEYIRKDALLKWIQEARPIPHENAITRDLAFQEIVNKLNSM
jgi:hypothetical protein